MSMRSKVSSRFFAVLTLMAVVAVGSLRADDSQVDYDCYTSPEGTSYAAVGMRGVQITTESPMEVVFLVDTSASQVGQTREDSLETLRSTIDNLPEGTKVKLLAMDVDTDALTPDFAEKGSPELAAAIQKLQRRVPLGATDMTKGLHTAKAAFDGRDPGAKRSVLYLGDGRSMAKTVDVADFQKEVDDYRDARIPFNACAVGVQSNLGLIGAFVNQTGGNLVDMNATVQEGYDNAVDTALQNKQEFAVMPNFGRTAGQKLADAAAATVVWPDRDSYAFPDSWEVYPKTLPPVRSDRETIVVAKTDSDLEPFTLKLKGATPGNEMELAWNFAPNKLPGNQNANKYLSAVVDTAAKDAGLTMPIVGWNSLDSIRDGYIANIADQLNKAETAINIGNPQQAIKLLDNVRRLDPNNATAKRLSDAAQNAMEEGGASDADNGDLATTTDPGPLPSMVDSAMKEQTATTQKIENEVRQAIVDASSRMHQAPEAALQNLKMTQAMVRDNTSLSPDQRNSMLDRLGNMIKQTEHAGYLKDVQMQRAAEVAAGQRERQLSLQGLEENRIKAVQIFDRFNALMDAGEYKVANSVAHVAMQMLPEDSTPFTATVLSEMTTYITEYNDLRHKRHIGFVESLMESERSFIPIPDEPPLTYIEPERWLLLSERRKERYSVADLSNTGPAEKKIAKALERNIDLELDESQTFEDLFNLIKDKNPGMNVGLDQNGAGQLGITLSTPIVREPLSYHGIKLRSALRLILAEQDLTYCIKDEVLLITSVDEAKKYMSVKVYPLADLVLDPTPKQSAGAGGMSSMMNGGGMGGGMGGMGGGMGGMGGGMGGMGGGMGGMGGGMGGGMFSIPNAVRNLYGASQLNGTPANGFNGGFFSVPSEKRSETTTDQKSEVLTDPNSKTQTTELSSAQKNARDAIKEALAAKDPRAYWEKFFEAKEIDQTKVKEIVFRMVDQLKAKKMSKEGLKNAQAMKADTVLEDQIIALVESALLSGNVQGWMYEALALSLYLKDAPKKEIERAVLSAADFCENPIDLMNIALFMEAVGVKERAFLLYKQALEVMTPKQEFYSTVLRLANEIDDEAATRWICLATLAIEWDGASGQRLTDNALHTIDGLRNRMEKSGRTEEAAELAADIHDARRRDCIITIQWTGDAGLDLSVREPTDSFCWFGNSRTLSGGLLKTKPLGQNATLTEKSGVKEISYVCPKGFNGQYAAVIRSDWGTPANNLVKVFVANNAVAGATIPEATTLEMDPEGVVVYFDLDTGRRTESLEEGELDEASLRLSIAQQQIARNNALKRLSEDKVVAQMLGGVGGSGEFGGSTGSSGSGRRYLPLYGPSVVGYRPVITVLPEGASISPTAVVSPDRRYVRIIDPSPMFTTIRKVTSYNMQQGSSDNNNNSNSSGSNNNSSNSSN